MKKLLIILTISLSFYLFAQEDVNTSELKIEDNTQEVISDVKSEVKNLDEVAVINLPSPEEAKLDEVNKAPDEKPIPQELDKKEIHRSKSLVIYAVLLILLVGIITGVAHLFPNGKSEEKS
ncbi:MAG: hypothetical protein NE330_00240 [Lentisphaeraceae bacterium]|nr:hypothetical protein [Lentisphaeraceae bacterium]